MVLGGGFHLAVLRSTNNLLSDCAKGGMMRDEQSISCAPAS